MAHSAPPLHPELPGSQPGTEQDSEPRPLCISIVQFCPMGLVQALGLSKGYVPLESTQAALKPAAPRLTLWQEKPGLRQFCMAFMTKCCSRLPTLPPKTRLLLETSKPPVNTAHTQEPSRKRVSPTSPLWRTTRRQLEQLTEGLTANYQQPAALPGVTGSLHMQWSPPAESKPHCPDSQDTNTRTAKK